MKVKKRKLIMKKFLDKNCEKDGSIIYADFHKLIDLTEQSTAEEIFKEIESAFLIDRKYISEADIKKWNKLKQKFKRKVR